MVKTLSISYILLVIYRPVAIKELYPTNYYSLINLHAIVCESFIGKDKIKQLLLTAKLYYVLQQFNTRFT